MPPSLAERRLVIVSNRLPFNVTVDKGRFSFHPSAGGLATGLASYLDGRKQTASAGRDYLWVGWPGTTVDVASRQDLTREALASFHSRPVFLSATEMEQFYFGFCNSTIWPLFHYFPSFAVYQPTSWEQYKRVNEVFCDVVAEVVQSGDLVWVHDYHLMLLPRLLKARKPELSVGFFLHIPFPSFEVFRLLPRDWRRQLLEGLLGADLVGFHTYEYAHHFLRCVLRILGYEHHMAQLLASDHVVKVDSFPMGINFEKFFAAPADPDVSREARDLKATFSNVKIILSVDRLDYSKGILKRLEGYERFLEMNPEYQGRVVLLMIVVPSRIGVRQYSLMKRQLEERVGKINGRFGRVTWTPVVYQYRHVPFTSLVAFYASSDVCIVTPLRDGMNLIAKEYIAARRDGSGVLILSEMAGSVKELPEAIIINPNNGEEIAAALKEALETPLEQQTARNQIMQRRLRRYDVNRWANEFLTALAGVREAQTRIEATLLSAQAKNDIMTRYGKTRRRALFLDYDGTLTPLARYPTLARPGEQTLGLLRTLAADPENTVIIISGRDRETLENWFGALPVGLVAEHGAWAKRSGESWQFVKPLVSKWKRQLLPILESYADRLPGAFVEEKENSAAWHYRVADPEQAGFLAAELTDHLNHLIAKTDLQVFQGNKVVELKHAGVDKGSAALQWLMKPPGYDFVLAIGDDTTDEDLFTALPDWAVTIRVGVAASHARHNLRNSGEVQELLESLAQLRGPDGTESAVVPLS